MTGVPSRPGAPADSDDLGVAASVVETIVPHPPALYRAPIEYDGPTGDVAIGVVVPFDFELDWEYWRYLPEGVSLYFTRTPHLRKAVGLGLARDIGRPSVVARATKALLALDPSVVLYACSSGSFVAGLGGEQAIREAMLTIGARRAVTTSGATADALRAIGAQRVAVATPYTRGLTAKLVAFLEESGFDVLSTHYLGIDRNISAVSRATIADLVRATHHPRADAVYVSCTALRTYGVVAGVEEELGQPVLTANQVSLWGALRVAAAELLDPEHPGWVLGGGNPMARSTQLLIEAAGKGREGVA